jgi:hypothetical protein
MELPWRKQGDLGQRGALDLQERFRNDMRRLIQRKTITHNYINSRKEAQPKERD